LSQLPCAAPSGAHYSRRRPRFFPAEEYRAKTIAEAVAAPASPAPAPARAVVSEELSPPGSDGGWEEDTRVALPHHYAARAARRDLAADDLGPQAPLVRTRWAGGRAATAASSRPATTATGRSLADFVESSRREWVSTRQHARAVAEAGRKAQREQASRAEQQQRWASGSALLRGGVAEGLGLLDEAPPFPRRSVSENFDRVRPGAAAAPRKLSTAGMMGSGSERAEVGKWLGGLGDGLRKRVRDISDEERARKMEEERQFHAFIKAHTGRTRLSQRKQDELRAVYQKHLHEQRRRSALDAFGGTLFDIQRRMEEDELASSDEDTPPAELGLEDPFGSDSALFDDPFPPPPPLSAGHSPASPARGGPQDLPSRGARVGAGAGAGKRAGKRAGGDASPERRRELAGTLIADVESAFEAARRHSTSSAGHAGGARSAAPDARDMLAGTIRGGDGMMPHEDGVMYAETSFDEFLRQPMRLSLQRDPALTRSLRMYHSLLASPDADAEQLAASTGALPPARTGGAGRFPGLRSAAGRFAHMQMAPRTLASVLRSPYAQPPRVASSGRASSGGGGGAPGASRRKGGQAGGGWNENFSRIADKARVEGVLATIPVR
jgi:hypothetical protein